MSANAGTDTVGSAGGKFTGYHIAVILVAFFAVVIGVNLYMARQAVSTFGGVVVENSYVASQHFNRWLDAAEREKALGWDAAAQRGKDGVVRVTLKGVPEAGLAMAAVARHPLGRLPDQALTFQREADGSYTATQPLPQGRWRIRLTLTSGGQTWRSEAEL